MYIITKEFHFSASHTVEKLEDTHPCSRIHGHNYIVKVELKSELLNKSDMVRDYRLLYPIKEYIDYRLDHRHLNDILPMNPTAENMCKYFYDTFKQMVPEISAIEISETPKTNARYEE